MKNTIVKYGIISGIIAGTLLFIITLLFKGDKAGFEYGTYIGYGSMIVSMSLIYFGLRSYREQADVITLTFGKGLLLGLGIMLISCIIYSLIWLIIYYNFVPNFINEYGDYCIQKTKSAGATQIQLSKTIADINDMKEWYKSPFLIFMITLTEPIPVGVLIALISAFLLRKK